MLYRFQFTIITCRTTIYVLFSFWLFFFFFGESLLLTLFNFTTITDSIPSNYFFTFKYHTNFSLNSYSYLLSSTIMFFITFFTISAFLFLLNLRYTFNFFYFDLTAYLDFFFTLIFVYLFINVTVFQILFFLISYFKYINLLEFVYTRDLSDNVDVLENE